MNDSENTSPSKEDFSDTDSVSSYLSGKEGHHRRRSSSFMKTGFASLA